MQKTPIVAVNLAIINGENRLLIAKRAADKPMPNKWEFPGGKLEENESLEACGVREIKEELELDISIELYLGYEHIHYQHKDFILHLFTARLKEAGQKFVLNEHSDARWLTLEELDEYDFPAGELAIMHKIKEAVERYDECCQESLSIKKY